MSIQYSSNPASSALGSSKRPFAEAVDLSPPTKRLNLRESSCSSGPKEADMSDNEEVLAPRPSAKAKGKGRMVYMRELPEVVWTRIFEHVYDSAFARWGRDYHLKDAMAPLLIDKETHSIALAVLYRHPHLSYDTLQLFARCAPLPARSLPGSKASIVRHLTIRASTNKPLVPPKYDPSALPAADYRSRSRDHTIPCYTIHPALRDVCSLFPELNTFELVDTLLLHSDDAKLLFEALRSFKPRKARLEIRQWDLRSSPMGQDLSALARPNIHGAYSRMPASSETDDTDRPWEGRGSPSIPIPFQAEWRDALLNGGEVVLPTWYIEPPPPPQNPAPAPAVIPPHMPTFFHNMPTFSTTAMPYHNAGLGSRNQPIEIDDIDDETDSAAHRGGGPRTLSVGRSFAATPTAFSMQSSPRASIGSATIHPGPDVSSITTELESGLQSGPSIVAMNAQLRSSGSLVGDATSPPPHTPAENIPADPAIALDGTVASVTETSLCQGNEVSATTRAEIGQMPVAGHLRGLLPAANRLPTQEAPRPIAPSAQILDNTSYPFNTRSSTSTTSPLPGQRGSSDSVVGNAADGAFTRAPMATLQRPAEPYRSRTVYQAQPTGGAASEASRGRATRLATDTSTRSSNWFITPQKSQSDIVFQTRMDHLYAADHDMQAAVFASYSPATVSNSLTRRAMSTGSSSSATIPMPRQSAAVNSATLGADPIGVPTPTDVHATSFHLSHEMRRMLGDLLADCWCPRLEAFSFVALDPLASVIVRHPRVELWVQLPIPHIRVHLPRGVSSLALFKGVKELARESNRRGWRAAGANVPPIQPPDVDLVLDQMRIVAGDGEGRDLVHPSTRLFEIEVNTIAEMNDESEWIGSGDQLPSQLCRILVGTQQWRDVIIGPDIFSPSSQREVSEQAPSPSSSQFNSPTFSFMDDSADEVSELSIDHREAERGGDNPDQSAVATQGRREEEEKLVRVDEDEEEEEV